MGSALAGTCLPAQIWVVIRLGTGGRWAGSPLASLLLKLLWQMGKFPYLQLLVMSVFLQVLKALSFFYIFVLLTMPWVKKLGMSLVTNDQLTAAKLLRNTAELGPTNRVRLSLRHRPSSQSQSGHPLQPSSQETSTQEDNKYPCHDIIVRNLKKP